MGFSCLFVSCIFGKCKTGLQYMQASIFQAHVANVSFTHINIPQKQNIHMKASVARFSLWSLFFVQGVYICVCICICGSREAHLPQLSTLALALKSDGPFLPGCPWTPCSPAHYSLGPRAMQVIYYPQRERERKREQAQHQPLSPPSQSFSPSSLFTPSTPALLLSHSVYLKKKNPPLERSPAFSFSPGLEFFRLISLSYPPFFCQSQLENTRIAVS